MPVFYINYSILLKHSLTHQKKIAAPAQNTIINQYCPVKIHLAVNACLTPAVDLQRILFMLCHKLLALTCIKQQRCFFDRKKIFLNLRTLK
jgi:hypothetical protein